MILIKFIVFINYSSFDFFECIKLNTNSMIKIISMNIIHGNDDYKHFASLFFKKNGIPLPR